VNFASYSGPFPFPNALQPGSERAQLIERTVPFQNVVQEALDLPRGRAYR